VVGGRIIADRFELGAPVAAGATATIHRATGGRVAVKVLRGRAPDQVVRFEREASVLTTLRAPPSSRARSSRRAPSCW